MEKIGEDSPGRRRGRETDLDERAVETPRGGQTNRKHLPRTARPTSNKLPACPPCRQTRMTRRKRGSSARGPGGRQARSLPAAMLQVFGKPHLVTVGPDLRHWRPAGGGSRWGTEAAVKRRREEAATRSDRLDQALGVGEICAPQETLSRQGGKQRAGAMFDIVAW